MTAPRRRLGVLLALLAVVGAGSFVLVRIAPRSDGPPPARSVSLEGGDLRLEPVFDAGTSIVALEPANDGSGRLFLVEQRGLVRVVEDGMLADAPLLDLRDRVLAGGERGLLGIAPGPDFPDDGLLYVNYTAQPDGRTVVSRFVVPPGADVVDPGSEMVVLQIPQPYANHNAGGLRFGPDGMLWIATGDGGAGGDPEDRAQNPDELLGKILRIDVSADGTDADGSADGPPQPYAIPPDNPFVSGGGRPEVWAIGLRNPWRYAFDPSTRDLWIADVGQNAWEEIDRVTWDVVPPLDFGWDTTEGTHCFEPAFACERTGSWAPLYEYSHDDGCSVTGGVVYRGKAIPELQGVYLFADFCGGWIRGLRPVRGDPELGDDAPPGRSDMIYEVETLFESTGLPITAFGEDTDGEVYVLSHTGVVHRLVAR